MVFSAFYLIMIRYRIGLRCIILLDCYIMNKESSLRACLKKGFLQDVRHNLWDILPG